MFKTGSLFADPVLDAPLAPPHPYPGWKPTGRGDASALAPYIDDDLREEHEPSNPVATGLDILEKGHVAAEGIVNGGKRAKTLGEMAAKLGHESTELFTGEADAAHTALGGASAVLAPLSIAGGGLDLWEAKQAWDHGEHGEAGYKTVKGATGIGGGATGILALGGAGGAGLASTAFGSFGVGLGVGHFADGQLKDSGWLRDGGGKSLSASEWAADVGGSVDNWVTRHGFPHAGTALGTLTTLGASIPGAGMALGATVANGYDALNGLGHSIGRKAANWRRTSKYAHREGMDLTHHEAQELADYDDQQQAAVERSKREHPEKWGENPT